MDILHVGCFVQDIGQAVEDYKKLGYIDISKDIVNTSMGIIGRFMKNNNLVVELIGPIDEESSIFKLREKLGVGPYHICYKSLNLKEDISRLRKEGYMVISSGEKTSEEEHNFAFLYNLNVGFIELHEVD